MIQNISISEFRYAPYLADKDFNIKPSEVIYNNGHDFERYSDDMALGINMTCQNELFRSAAVHRCLSVNLVDTTGGNVLASVDMPVSMARNVEKSDYYVSIPLDEPMIKKYHTGFKINVADKRTGRVIYDTDFNIFDKTINDRYYYDWYTPVAGGVSLSEDGDIFRSVDCAHAGSVYVKFHVKWNLEYSFAVMPELEIRLYYSKNQVKNHYARPVRDEATGRYVVTSLFETSCLDENVPLYAALFFLDVVIGGFAFGTYSNRAAGGYSENNLKFLTEYSQEAVEEWYKSNNGGLCDEEYDRRIREFVSYAKTGVRPGESLLKPLDHLTGLTSVKAKLETYEKLVCFNRMRADNGLPVCSLPLHAMFMGSPGTGKTTVAKLMGEMLAHAGVLSRGHVVVKERATLIGPYYSNEETNTQKAIEEAHGGILFIDEAYQLFQPNDPRDPGKFVIEALMTALADESNRDWMLILAGYPDKMRAMFEMNPGLKSRIPESNVYTFDDFTESELMEIAERYLARNNFALDDGAREALTRRLRADYENRDSNFGNARHVVNMIQTEILPAMAIRVMTAGAHDVKLLSEISACDIKERTGVDVPVRRPVGFRA